MENDSGSLPDRGVTTGCSDGVTQHTNAAELARGFATGIAPGDFSADCQPDTMRPEAVRPGPWL